MTNWIAKLFEGGKTTEELAKQLGLATESLKEWELGKPERYGYTTFEIPKRNKRGYRQIEAPDSELKKLQRGVHQKFLRYLQPHPACLGFRYRKSIVDNAKNHTGKAVVINLDLKDFFPSINQTKIKKYFRKIGWGKTVARILTNICTSNARLPQGAPTSPALSNLVNYKMDQRMTRLALKYEGSYSRYADDLTFSFKVFGRKQRVVLKKIAAIIKDEGFEIQKKKKVRIQRQHQKQTVTGLVVNKKVNLDRKLRRIIRAMEFQKRNGELAKNKINRLLGYQSLAQMVDKQR
ncbi:MAG: retron St85 family RNA-directed DNA polymerase [Candidatus Shapirobacteria bacterium]|jgi:retron-type reverse transcriptase